MKTVIDESALKLFVAQMEALQCVVLALQARGGLSGDELAYVLEARIKGRAEDDLTALGVAQLLQFLQPKVPPAPQLRLIPGGLSGPDRK